MLTVIDLETTFQISNGKKDPSPQNPHNRIVSIGWRTEDISQYRCVYSKCRDADEGVQREFQDVLDRTTVLAAHNRKFDQQWLYAAGFTYSGAGYCTMLTEYVLHQGLRVPLNLSECCLRYDISPKKSDLIEDYMKKNVSFEHIPWDVVETYGRQDIDICFELVKAQWDKLGITLEDVEKWAF